MTSPVDDVSVASGAGPFPAAAAVCVRSPSRSNVRVGPSSVTGYHLCPAGTTHYRGGEPAVPRGDAEYVESQRAGGQSVSTDAQVELGLDRRGASRLAG